GSGGDDAIGDVVNDVILTIEPLLGSTLVLKGGNAVFHVPQGVEHLHDGDVCAPNLTQPFGDQPGEPVMAVDEVVTDALAPCKLDDPLGKLVGVLFNLSDGDWLFGASRNVNDAAAKPQIVVDIRYTIILGAGKN